MTSTTAELVVAFYGAIQKTVLQEAEGVKTGQQHQWNTTTLHTETM